MTIPEFTTEFQRPMKAKLVVQLDNGESWDATTDDLERFQVRGMAESYTLVYGLLCRLGMDPTGKHSSLRYLLERTLSYPLDADLGFDPADQGEDKDVLDNVRAGLAAWPEENDD